MFLLSICMYSLEKVYLDLLPIFLLGCLFFFDNECMSYLCILEINPLLVASFAIIFSHSEDCFFNLFIVSFAVQKLLSFIMSHLFTLLVFPLIWGAVRENLAVIYVRVY